MRNNKLIAIICIIALVFSMTSMVSADESGLTLLLDYDMNNAIVNDSSTGTKLVNSVDSSKNSLTDTILTHTYTSGYVNNTTYSKQRYVGSTGNFSYISGTTDVGTAVNGGMTFEAWLNIQATNVNPYIWNLTSSSGSQISLRYYASTKQFVLMTKYSKADGTTSLYQQQSPRNSMSAGSWKHIVLTYDNSSAANNPKLYIDGQEVALTLYVGNKGTTAIQFASDATIKFSGSDQQLQTQYARMSLYSGIMDAVTVQSRYLATRSGYAPINDIKLFRDNVLVGINELETVSEGNFTAELDLSGLDSSTVANNFYIENTDTGEKVMTSGAVNGSVYKLNATQLFKGNYAIVFNENVLKADNTPLRNYPYNVKFSVSENPTFRAMIASELSALSSRADIENYLFVTYKSLFNIDRSDYDSVINKDGVITIFKAMDNSTVQKIINNFESTVELQKIRDFDDAVTELNGYIASDNYTQMEYILFTKYAAVYQLDITGNYAGISDQTEVMRRLAEKTYLKPEDVKAEFNAICLILGLNESADANAYISGNSAEFSVYIDLTNRDYLKYVSKINQAIKNAESATKLSNMFYEQIILNSLNNVETGNRDEIKRIIDDYSGYITLPANYILYSNKSEVYKYMSGNTYSSLLDITSALDAATEEAKANPSDNSSHEINDEKRYTLPPVSGEGVVPREENPVVAFLDDDTTESAVDMPFDDVAEIPWAWEALEYLKEAGIISGKDDGIFAPNDIVTREEYVKMIVGAFGVKHTKTELVFSDVNMDEWYYPYIMWAYAEGIVTGTSAATFGVGEIVSREDAAVILARVAKYKGASLTVDSTRFADSALISDYATEAVHELKATGVLSGDEHGFFNPKSGTTRAEAAKMIYVMLNTVKKGA